MTRPKTCKGCGEKFQPATSLHVVCSVPCLWAYKAKQDAKTDRRITREARERLKTRAQWMEDAQKWFNKFIRLRDADKPCISCGRIKVEWTRGGEWDCGHFLGRGAYPELRFDENNAAKQCKSCNGGSGKYARKNHTVSQSYRANLIDRIGLEGVEELEGPHEAKHYTIDDLRAIRKLYQAKCKELEA